MKIKLTNEESEEIFHNAMCNGMDLVSCHGLRLDIDKEAYKTAKENLQKTKPKLSICREDIWSQVLKDGNELTLIDFEGDDERHSITLKDVHERVQNTDSEHILAMINEEDDVITADCIIQTVFFNEIVFG